MTALCLWPWSKKCKLSLHRHFILLSNLPPNKQTKSTITRHSHVARSFYSFLKRIFMWFRSRQNAPWPIAAGTLVIHQDNIRSLQMCQSFKYLFFLISKTPKLTYVCLKMNSLNCLNIHWQTNEFPSYLPTGPRSSLERPNAIRSRISWGSDYGGVVTRHSSHSSTTRFRGWHVGRTCFLHQQELCKLSMIWKWLVSF